MKRIAGMTIEDGRASIFVLAREGDTWRVESRGTYPIDTCPAPACPVVLGAAAWWPQAAIDTVARLRARGFDVRPLLWIDGRAADPTPQQLIDAPGYLDLFHSLVPGTDISLHGAMSCAAWGATQETTAEPPRCATAAVWAHSADVDAVPGARAAEVPRVESEIARLTRERDEARRERDEAVRRAVRAESLVASLSREMESLGRVGQAYKDERDEAIRLNHQMNDAWAAGIQAERDGKSEDECPYSEARGDVEWWLKGMWRLGHNAQRAVRRAHAAERERDEAVRRAEAAEALIAGKGTP